MRESPDSLPVSIDERCEPLDPERLETLKELQDATGVDLLDELTELFLTDVPRRADELRAAVAAGDFATAKQIAHSIKGSCSNLGAQRVEVVAVEIETRVAAGGDSSSELGEWLDQLGIEIERASKFLVESPP